MNKRGCVLIFIGVLLVLMIAVPIDMLLTWGRYSVAGHGVSSSAFPLLIALVPAVLAGMLFLSSRLDDSNLVKISLSAGSVFVCLFIIEIALRIFWTPPSILCGWRSLGPNSEKNELDFRGHPIRYSPEDYVIVLLGDSQAEAVACAYGWMPERRLEFHLNTLHPGLNFRVFTVGAGGYGQDQQLLALSEYFESYRANLVVLWQTIANDVWNNMFPTHWPANTTPKPTFRLENGDLVGPNQPMGEEMFKVAFRLSDMLFDLFFAKNRLDDVWETVLPEPYAPLESHTGPVNLSWQAMWDENIGIMRDENLANEKSHFAIALTPRSPRMQYGLDLTRALLLGIRALAEAHSAGFILFEACSVDHGADDSSEVYLLNGNYYRVADAQEQANKMHLNAGLQMISVPVTLEDWRVGPADGHLNQHAVDQVMNDLAAILRSVLPIRNFHNQNSHNQWASPR